MLPTVGQKSWWGFKLNMVSQVTFYK